MVWENKDVQIVKLQSLRVGLARHQRHCGLRFDMK